MTTRHATPHIICLAGEPSEPLATGVFVADVLTLAADASAPGPEWIMIAPRGRFTARDGRQFEVDPEQLVSRFTAEGVDIPIDVDHATVKKAMFGEAAPAVAWIKELAARPDGVHGRVEWLAAGLRILSRKTHRYISPSLKADEQGVVSWLHSAALVAAPALSMPSVASADPTTTKDSNMLKQIAAALGLSVDANEASCLAAIATLSQGVTKAVHDQTLATLSTTTTELEALKKGIRENKVTVLLDDALAKKKITPAQKPHFETLCSTDAGLGQVEELLKAMAPGLQPSGLEERKTPEGVYTLTAEDKTIMKELGLPEEAFRKANGLVAA